MLDVYKNKTILVTGGTGSIGSELVRQLLNFDIKKVVVFSRGEIKQFLLKQDIDNDKLECIIGNIRNYNSLQRVFERNAVDIVFHAAAMKHVVVCENEPVETAYTNIFGTHNLIRLCIKYGVKNVLTISTDKAASPTNVMGATKFISERICLNANRLTGDDQLFSCVRFGNVANSRGSVIPVMVKRMIDGKNICVSNPDVTRFIMTIPDAVNLVLDAVRIAQGGEIFVLKMKSFRLGDLAEIMKNIIAPRLNMEVQINNMGMFFGEKLHEDLLNDIEGRTLLANEKMYIVINDTMKPRIYEGFTVSNTKVYNSQSAKYIDIKELENIVMEHIIKEKYLR